MGVVENYSTLEKEIFNFLAQDEEKHLKNELCEFHVDKIFTNSDFIVHEYKYLFYRDHALKFVTTNSKYIEVAFLFNDQIIEDKINGAKNVYLPNHNYVYYTPNGVNVEIYYKKDVMYRNLDIYLAKDFFNEFIQETKYVNSFIGFITKEKFTRLVKEGVPISPQMVHTLSEIKECKLTGIPKEYFMKSKIMYLLQLIFEWIEENKDQSKNHLSTQLKDADINTLHEIHSFIEDNPKVYYTTEQLSELFAMNEFKLKKGFKELFGMGLFQFSTQVHMKYALYLLKNSDLSIKEIAYKTGYSSPSSFSVAFKKECGISPNKMRIIPKNS